MNLVIFLKGFLMGVCDIIPGISGGTIAFITGIYSRLINAVKNISFRVVLDIFGYLVHRDDESLGKVKEGFKRMDLGFLVVLGLGIGSAVLIMSRVVSFLLDNYFGYTISFFVGLILASSKTIYDKIERHHSVNVLFGVVGLVIGLVLAVIRPLEVTPSLSYVFLGGFLAISAMFLPGISGAFILLIMGMYKFMLDVLHDITGNIGFFLMFLFGAGLGAFTISHLIAFLFKKDRCKTLYVLLGLVIGALSIPVKEVVSGGNLDVIMGIFLISGFLSVTLVGKFVKVENGTE